MLVNWQSPPTQVIGSGAVCKQARHVWQSVSATQAVSCVQQSIFTHSWQGSPPGSGAQMPPPPTPWPPTPWPPMPVELLVAPPWPVLVAVAPPWPVAALLLLVVAPVDEVGPDVAASSSPQA
jgi:hypothetical protein